MVNETEKECENGNIKLYLPTTNSINDLELIDLDSIVNLLEKRYILPEKPEKPEKPEELEKQKIYLNKLKEEIDGVIKDYDLKKLARFLNIFDWLGVQDIQSILCEKIKDALLKPENLAHYKKDPDFLQSLKLPPFVEQEIARLITIEEVIKHDAMPERDAINCLEIPCIKTLEFKDGTGPIIPYLGIAFNKNGGLVLDRHGEIVIGDIEGTIKKSKKINYPTNVKTALSPYGKYLVITAGDNLTIYDIENDENWEEQPNEGLIYRFQFSPCGNYLIFYNKKINIYDIAGRKIIKSYDNDDHTAIALSSGGKYEAKVSGGEGNHNRINITDLTKNSNVSIEFNENRENKFSIFALSPSGKQLISADMK
jgi:WD40 repeat protein